MTNQCFIKLDFFFLSPYHILHRSQLYTHEIFRPSLLIYLFLNNHLILIYDFISLHYLYPIAKHIQRLCKEIYLHLKNGPCVLLYMVQLRTAYFRLLLFWKTTSYFSFTLLLCNKNSIKHTGWLSLDVTKCKKVQELVMLLQISILREHIIKKSQSFITQNLYSDHVMNHSHYPTRHLLLLGVCPCESS